MASKKKLLQAAAGSAGGAGLDVNEVFSTYLWDGNGSSQTIVNGIDLSGEGGLVWEKVRNQSYAGGLYDTERGVLKQLRPDNTDATNTRSGSITAFNSNGFSIGNDTFQTNGTGNNYASWTFRKAPKFFDVVTYTGTGSAMTIDHNLGSVPAMIIVKSTSASYDWAVWHREFTGTTDYIKLNTSAAKTDSAGVFGNGSTYLTPTSTQFFVGGNNQVSGEVGGSYVAYLFAHNDGDGEFGPDGDADVIKCGSYTGNGSDNGPEINLGFEPQWVIIKSATSADSWWMFDNMRGMSVNYGAGVTPTTARDAAFIANGNNAEMSYNMVGPTATGFQLEASDAAVNGSGNTYIYMAIRRGPLAPPESATDVFAIDLADASGTYTAQSGFPVDTIIYGGRTGTDKFYSFNRLTGSKYLKPNTTDAESTYTADFDKMESVQFPSSTGNYSNYINWMWKRAPSYFDVVAYTGTGNARTVAHNLGVAPEMMWMKCRSDTEAWAVYHNNIDSSAPEDYGIYLNDTAQRVDSANFWNDTAPTSSVFTVGTAGKTNGNTQTYIAYLFATVAGVSKVGSFSHTNGSTTDVDCGFSSGARFVLLKRYTDTGSWIVFDSVRGIVAGNDPFLKLDSTDAETTGNDVIDPLSSGFQVASGYLATGDWIFYAIA